jgi:hypothetical protein
LGFISNREDPLAIGLSKRLGSPVFGNSLPLSKGFLLVLSAGAKRLPELGLSVLLVANKLDFSSFFCSYLSSGFGSSGFFCARSILGVIVDVALAREGVTLGLVLFSFEKLLNSVGFESPNKVGVGLVSLISGSSKSLFWGFDTS